MYVVYICGIMCSLSGGKINFPIWKLKPKTKTFNNYNASFLEKIEPTDLQRTKKA